ncbi:SHOCT domain-containing protein [Lentibacillus salicampi]|uniref:SHOCT domain-containing protein n=1 Tax=Lentibacillus salicampi TaxID=175306 RepID=A0A4Y9AGZ1_9BACI|nr:SHOCT domain-containing protein [Lentibacillus salicampi]TFJ93651.1 SHOCT domain-containing protein [Lentibacillus salicampi]
MSSESRYKFFITSFFVLGIGGFFALFINETLGTVMIFSSLGMVVIIIISAYSIGKENEIQFYELVNKTKSELTNFSIDKEYTSKDDKLVVLVDENIDSVCFFSRDNLKDGFNINKYTYRDILEIEIIQDGNTLTKTNRGSQVGGALLGSVLAGGVGAVIGGLSGSSTSEDKVESLCLRIVVNDTNNPVRLVYFLKHKFGVRKSEDIFVHGKKDLEYWYSLFKIYINEADKEDEKERNETNDDDAVTTNQSVVEEIREFGKLLEDGLITQEEYNAKKEKILT